MKSFFKKQPKNKFFATKTIDGDSKGESKRYFELKSKQENGEIKELQKQPQFILQESFRYKPSERIESSIKYTADFQYFDIKKNKWIVEEYKSKYTRKLADYSIRRRLFKYSIRDKQDIEFIEIIR